MAFNPGVSRAAPRSARPTTTHTKTEEPSNYTILESPGGHMPEKIYSKYNVKLVGEDERELLIDKLDLKMIKHNSLLPFPYAFLEKNTTGDEYFYCPACGEKGINKAKDLLYSHRELKRKSARQSARPASTSSTRSLFSRLTRRTTKPATGGRKRRHTRKHVHKRTHRPRRHTKHRHSRRCKH